MKRRYVCEECGIEYLRNDAALTGQQRAFLKEWLKSLRCERCGGAMKRRPPRIRNHFHPTRRA